MAAEPSTAGTFVEPGEAAQAIRALRAAGFARVRARMPAPYPEVVAALERPRSRLGVVSLSGAVLGLLLGVGLTVGTALDWPLVVGGKPVVSVPPFVVISFELTILVGGLATVAALALEGWRGRGAEDRAVAAGLEPGAIVVVVSGGDRAVAAHTLSAYGARGVHHA
jgi:hypothetical protein